MEVGVRTRSRAAVAKAVQSSEAAKRRKVEEFAKLKETSSFVELSDGRTVPAGAERSDGDRGNPTSDIDREAQASCCSSYFGSSEIADVNRNRERDGQKRTEENLQEEEVRLDLKDDDESNEVETSSSSSSCRERREMTPSSNLLEESDGVESTSKPTVVNPGRRSSSSSSPPLKMPSESELEEFFAAAEKNIQKRFADKYNFDIAKATPLEGGRYEWVRIKP